MPPKASSGQKPSGAMGNFAVSGQAPAAPAAPAQTPAATQPTADVQQITDELKNQDLQPGKIVFDANGDEEAALLLPVSDDEAEEGEVDSGKKNKTDKADDGDDEPEFAHNEAEEIPLAKIKPLKEGQNHLKELPESLKYPEEDADLYPEYLLGVYNYRAASSPGPAELQVQLDANDPRKLASKSKSNGPKINETKVVVMDFSFPNSEKRHLLGSFNKPQPGGEDCRVIKLSWILHSQVPGLMFKVTRGNGKVVSVIIHANSLQRGVNEEGTRAVGLGMFLTDEDSQLEHETLDPAKGKDGSLMVTRLNMAFSRQPFGPPTRRPFFDGISTEELNQLVATPSTELSEGDKVLVAIKTCTMLHIFRPWYRSDAGRQVFENFYNYWFQTMNDCAFNGNWPHYRRQAARVGKNISDRDFRIEDTVPPRDMVKSWRVTKTDGKVTSVEPESWLPFMSIGRYPDPESKGFAIRLSVERERNFGQAAIQEQLDAKEGSLIATVKSFPHLKDRYWFEINGDKAEGPIFQGSGHMRPKESTRVTVYVTDGDYTGAKFKGVVSDDAFTTGAELTVTARLLSSGLKQWDMGPGSVKTFKVSVMLDSDGTASNRQNAAVCELSHPLERDYGVDLPALAMNSMPTIPKTGSLWDEIKEDLVLQKKFWEVINSYHLNPDQQKAASTCLKSVPGVLLLHGPPGTGKTFTLMVIAIAHIIAGRLSGKPRQIIATAPSNAAADNMVRVLVNKVIPSIQWPEDIKPKDQKIKLCRFRGAGTGGRARRRDNLKEQVLANPVFESKQPREGPDSQDEEAMANIVWDYLEQMLGAAETDKELQPYAYYQQRRNFIDAIHKEGGHADNGKAVGWFKAKKALWSSKSTPEVKTAARKELDQYEWYFDQKYLQDVDIVFTTNSTAAHEILMDYFRPRILISDEGGLASFGDAIVPMASHKGSLELVILAGDHKQQGPPVLAKGASETYKDTERSLFEQLRTATEHDARVVLLRIQHRMKSSFSGGVSDVFYEGKLIDHESLSETSPLEITIKHGLRKLGEWNGRMRLGIDMSGPDAYSEQYEGSRSSVNVAEAAAIAEHIDWLLHLEPPNKNGRKVTPEDILVITPYVGQVSEIKKAIRKREMKYGKKALKIDIMTSATVQGSEREIVLLSWVRNKPGRPSDLGFAADSRQACVNHSRVKEYMVSFGNFVAWVQALIDGGSLLSQKSGKMRDVSRVIRHYTNIGDLYTSEQLNRLHKGLTADPDFAITKFLQPKKQAESVTGPRPTAALSEFQILAKEEQRKKRKRGNRGQMDDPNSAPGPMDTS